MSPRALSCLRGRLKKPRRPAVWVEGLRVAVVSEPNMLGKGEGGGGSGEWVWVGKEGEEGRPPSPYLPLSSPPDLGRRHDLRGKAMVEDVGQTGARNVVTAEGAARTRARARPSAVAGREEDDGRANAWKRRRPRPRGRRDSLDVGRCRIYRRSTVARKARRR